jgi:hypothetical protein
MENAFSSQPSNLLGSHPSETPTVCKYLPRSQGWEGWLAPAASPKSSLNTLKATLSNPATGELLTQYRSDSWASSGGKPPFPTLRSGEVLAQY